LIGATHSDTEDDARVVAAKLANLRVMADDEGVMNRSVLDVGGAVLVVSQFTLYGDVRKGRRPSWTDAAGGNVAEPLIEAVADELRGLGVTVATGSFGAMMDVSLTNDGPVTIVFEVSGGRVV
jgi:D-tyrosyl-tRNA(Tyr) deacylase